MNREDILYNKDDKRYISLSKLTGKKIADIEGYISSPYGDALFIMSRIHFEDGSSLYCEGEHDMAYLSDYDGDILHQEILEELCED